MKGKLITTQDIIRSKVREEEGKGKKLDYTKKLTEGRTKGWR